MISGLELLKQRTVGDQPDFRALEEKIGFTLPPLFKFFSEQFETGELNVNWPLCLRADGTINYIDGYLLFGPYTRGQAGRIKFGPYKDASERFFEGVFDVQELEKNWENYGWESEEWEDHKLFPIGSIGIGGFLSIGTTGEMLDKIYLVSWDAAEDYELLAENIFAYARQIVFRPDEFIDSQCSDRLYQKWAENFWRFAPD